MSAANNQAPSVTAALDAVIAHLFPANSRPKIWTIVISIYGDAVVPRGGAMALMALHEIALRMNIGSGALRTAMSRLTRDGWMERFRIGKNGFYRVNETVQETIQQASLRIYAPLDAQTLWQGDWQLAIVKKQEWDRKMIAALEKMGFIAINAALYTRFAKKNDPLPDNESINHQVIFMNAGGNDNDGSHAESFRTQNTEMLNIIRRHHKASQLYDALCDQFQDLATMLNQGNILTPLDALVARILLIHHWRRAVLADESGNDVNPFRQRAHLLSKNLYRQLIAPSEAWLDSALGIDNHSSARTLIDSRFTAAQPRTHRHLHSITRKQTLKGTAK